MSGSKILCWEMTWICLGMYLKRKTVVNQHASEFKFYLVYLNILSNLSDKSIICSINTFYLLAWFCMVLYMHCHFLCLGLFLFFPFSAHLKLHTELFLKIVFLISPNIKCQSSKISRPPLTPLSKLIEGKLF